MSSEVRIVKQADWNAMYEPYKANTMLSLHTHIALDASDEVVQADIQRCPHLIGLADMHHDGLTPLIIAAMKGRVAIVKALLQRSGTGIEKMRFINARDAHGWSAFMHAYFSSKKICTLLKNQGASEQVAIPFSDIELLRTKDVVSRSLQAVSVVLDDAQTVSLADFGIQKIGLQCYRDIPYYSDETLHLLWRKTVPSSDSIATKLYEKFLKKERPFEFVIGTCKELKNSQYHFELRTKGEIRAGTCFGMYAGAAIEASEKRYPSVIGSFKEKLQVETYFFDQFDAKDVGNCMRMANWGWPNAIADYAHTQGQRLPVMIAIDDIAPGEPILWNYFTMPCLSYYVAAPIFGADKMHQFYKRGFDAIFAECNELDRESLQGDLPLQRYLALQRLHGGLLFPLTFPVALLDLHYRAIVSIEKWISITQTSVLSSTPFMQGWFEQAKYSYFLVRAVCRHVWGLDKVIPGDALKQQIARWVLEKIGTFSVLQLIKAITMIQMGIKNGAIEDAASCDEILTTMIEPFLKTYDPADDEQCPLGPKEIWFHKLWMAQEGPGTLEDRLAQAKKHLETLISRGFTDKDDVVKEQKEIYRYFLNEKMNLLK